MKFVSHALRLSVVILLLFLAATITPSLAQGQNAPTDGAGLFKAKCAMCHGPDGAGKTPMGQKLDVRDLHSADVQKQADAALSQMIAQGKGKMPAFSQKLSDDQIKLLVAHVRNLGKK
ncbi:MAG TPA: cytochrome c [Terriglobales bacterium]|nr:cytochrome c [Terriglobales bacterium]